MARQAMNRFAMLGSAGVLFTGLFFSACSDDSGNPEPAEAGTGATHGTGGKGGSGNATSAGGKAGSGNTGNESGGSGNAGKDGGTAGSRTVDGGSGGTNPGDGGGSGGAETGGSPGMTDAGCVQDKTKTCGTCPPTTTPEFLNHCTDSKCTAFDNSKLEKFVNGKLPALP
jgi:hypothetical protein